MPPCHHCSLCHTQRTSWSWNKTMSENKTLCYFSHYFYNVNASIITIKYQNNSSPWNLLKAQKHKLQPQPGQDEHEQHVREWKAKPARKVDNASIMWEESVDDKKETLEPKHLVELTCEISKSTSASKFCFELLRGSIFVVLLYHLSLSSALSQ